MQTQAQQSTPSLLVGSGALNRAIVAAESMRKKAPRDARALSRLGALFRQTGQLDRAAEVYSDLLALDPQNAEAAYQLGLFTGRPTSRASSDWPANFLISKNHLPVDEYQRIVSLLEPVAKKVKPVLVHGKVPRADYVGALGPVEEWFKEHIRSQVSGWCEALRVSPFEPEVKGTSFTRYTNGEFYPVHNDSHNDKGHLLEVIYFVEFLPDTFRGGELLLFDEVGESSAKRSWTAVPPTPNTLIVFPSTHFHEIAAVRCESQDELAGRFMLASWLRAAT